MPEDTGVDFASAVDGDHARVRSRRAHRDARRRGARAAPPRHDLPGTVRFMFQPGEEGFHGARFMIDEGVLDDPHVDARVRAARHAEPAVGSDLDARPDRSWRRPTCSTSRSPGRAGTRRRRTSRTTRCRSPPRSSARSRCSSTRRIDTFDPVVITITKIRAGTTNNVIPEAVDLQGTLRSVSAEAAGTRVEGIERLVAASRPRTSMDADVVVEPAIRSTVNDDAFAVFASRSRREVARRASVGRMPAPVMGAEDFSYLLEQRPGALAFLGVCPPGDNPTDAHACHSNRMTIDEDAMQRASPSLCRRRSNPRPRLVRKPPFRWANARKLVVSSTAQGRLAQLVRALPSHGRGRRFESSTAHATQLFERLWPQRHVQPRPADVSGRRARGGPGRRDSRRLPAWRRPTARGGEQFVGAVASASIAGRKTRSVARSTARAPPCRPP